MATRTLNLYSRWTEDRLVLSPTNNKTLQLANLPPIVPGDIWDISVYFIYGGQYVRQGGPVSIRIRAQGNNRAYADAQSDFTIPPDITPVVIQLQSGNSARPEIQQVTFPAIPDHGSYKINFSGAGTGGRGGGFSLEGTTAAIAVADGGWLSAIRNIRGYYKGNEGPYTDQEIATKNPITFNGIDTTGLIGNGHNGITLQWGRLVGGASYWNTGIHLVDIDTSSLAYNWGRHVTLPFTVPDFSDYLVYGPAFLEVFLNGERAGYVQLTADPALAPAFTNGPPPNGTAGVSYRFGYTASGTPVPAFTLTAGSLPPGLTLDGAGVLVGIPTTAGTYAGTVTASSGNGTATQNFSIVIAAGTSTAPVFTSSQPPNSGTVGSPYDFTCVASGFPLPTFSVTAGSLPPGISLDSAGRISGTPIASGNYGGVITALNSAGNATQAFSIIIEDVVIHPPPVPGGIVNIAGILYDGDHGGFWAVGPIRRENAFPEIPGYYIYRQKWRAKRLNWGALILDALCPDDQTAFLVHESPTEDLGGADILEWERAWANVPGQIVEGEMVDYEVQQTGLNYGAAAMMSYHLTRWATRTKTFYHTSNPDNIPKNVLPRAFIAFGVIYITPGFTNLGSGARTIARDDNVERWMGNIWMRTEWYITI